MNSALTRPRVIFIGIGVLAIVLIVGRSVVKKPADSATQQASPAVLVDTARVVKADVPIYVQGLGTVQAFNTVTVTARVDGELEKVAFTEGQNVKRGDLLAQIDPRPNQASYQQALATRGQRRGAARECKA